MLLCRQIVNMAIAIHQDLHQFLQSMNEIDARLPECPDVEDKWEQIAKAYIPDGTGEMPYFQESYLSHNQVKTMLVRLTFQTIQSYCTLKYAKP